MIEALLAALLAIGSAVAPPPPVPALQDGFSIAVDSASGFRPVLRLRGVLADADLEEATRSGLPVRLSFRVELWRDGFIDDLAATESWSSVILLEPLDRQYIVRPRSGRALRFASYAGARQALEAALPLDMGPTRGGRYYYTATLRIETLSVSDLAELERWLQGELGPAVSGDRSIPGAVVEGAKRLMIRVLGLPTKHLDARSVRFRVS